MTSRIGIYSGTFDPVHAGHIAFATAALRACELDEVIFLPEEQPRGKQHVTAISHRKALLEKAIERTPGLRVVELSSRQFTIQETLPELHQKFGDAEFTLLIGSDIAISLPHWPDIGLLLAETPLAIGMRAQASQLQLQTVLQSVYTHLCPTFIHTDFFDFTSSKVRGGKAPHFNSAITEYIDTHTLYEPLVLH